ncbi:kinase-like domain-containing protein [Mycena olivaceomarginata]|nr:kinase-like domain-containing protein [Mycena olivaceomarginata]
MQQVNREARMWRTLQHPNILPFLEVYDIGAPRPALISPFCTFGHIGIYLKDHPSAPRHPLMHGVAFGLEYLHKNNVVHGDLKASNIMVDARRVPCICDFGISQILDQAGFVRYNTSLTRYLAPERFASLEGEGESAKITPASPPTASSDVYAFACLVLLILGGESPNDQVRTSFVTPQGLHSLRPNRRHYGVSSISHELWLLLDQCWAVDPHLRPTMAEILDSPVFGVIQKRESLIIPKLTLQPCVAFTGRRRDW